MGRKPKDTKGPDQPPQEYLNNLNSLRKFSAIADRRGRLQFATEAPLKALGYSQDDFLRKPFWEAGLFGDSQESRNAVKDGIVGALEGQSVECRVQAFTSDGTALPVTFNISPLKGAEGDIVGITAAGEPIEEPAVEDRPQEAMVSSLDMLLDNIQEAFFEINNSERLTLVSSSAAKLLGYQSSGEMIGLGTDQLWSNPEDRDKYLIELSRKGRLEKYHTTFLREDGTQVPVELTAHLMLDAKGEVMGSQGIFAEIGKRATPDVITGRKKEEPTGLQELVKKFITLTEQTGDAVAIVQDDTIKFANARLARILGYNVSELEGTKFTRYMSPQSPKLERKRADKSIAGERATTVCDIEIIRKDRKSLTVEFSSRTIDHGGRSAELIVLREKAGGSNIQEAPRPRRAKDFAQKCLDVAGVMIVALNDTGKITLMNEKGYHILGYDGELVGRDWFDTCLPEPLRDQVKGVFRQLMAGEITPMEYYENPVLTRDGEERIIAWHNTILTDEAGNIIGTLSSGEDITERKNAEGKLLRSEQYFRSLIENASDVIVVLDATGTILYQGPSIERLFGYKQEEQPGKNILGFVHQDDLPRITEAFGNLLQTSAPDTTGPAVFRVRHKNGSWRYVEAVGRNLLDDPGVKGVVINYRDVTERKQAEGLLQLANAYNRSLIEASLDPLVTIGSDGKITDVNAATETATGYTRDQLVGTDFCDYFADPEKARTGYQQVFRDGKVLDYALDLKHRDGHVTSVLYNASVYRNEANQVIGVFAAARDITKQKQTEETLLRIRKAVESASDAIGMSDPQGHHFYHNKAFTDLLEYTPEELDAAGGGPAAFADQDTARAVFGAIMRGESWSGELEMLSKSGRRIPALMRADAIKDEFGQIIGLIGVITDFTERKQAEELLKEGQERLKEIFSNANDALIYVDEGWRIVDANARVSELLGYAVDEVIGRPVPELSLFDEKELSRLAMITMNALTTGEAHRFLETEIRHRDGHKLPVEVSTRAIISSEGKTKGFVSIIRDISERRLQEAKLTDYQERLKDALTKLRVSYEELSTPVVQIWDHVLAMPLIGVLDTHRARNVMEVLLSKIVEARAEVVVLDVTGVATMDTQVTNHLLQTAASTELLGAECVITGIKPEVAQAMIHIGVDITRLNTKRDLQEGLKYALSKMGHNVGGMD